MSLSGKMNFLGGSSLPCSPQGRQSGRMPDPVIGSASRHGRLTAHLGGALIGRDRPLQCEKVSKANALSARAAGGGGEVGGSYGPSFPDRIPAAIGRSQLFFEPPVGRLLFVLVPAAC